MFFQFSESTVSYPIKQNDLKKIKLPLSGLFNLPFFNNAQLFGNKSNFQILRKGG